MKRTKISQYDQQANRFLARYSVNVDIKLAEQQDPPPWTKSGYGRKYNITITQVSRDGSVEFPFWGSIKMREDGTHPTAYDILACISSDMHYDYSDYDLSYEQNERAAEFSSELLSFFTEAEQEALSEIC